jgi:hypothetical protein
MKLGKYASVGIHACAVLAALALGFYGAWNEQVDQSDWRVSRAFLSACSNLTLQFGDLSPQRHWASIAAALLALPIFASVVVAGAISLMLPQYMRLRLALAREHLIFVGIGDSALQILGTPAFRELREGKKVVLVDRRQEVLALAREQLPQLDVITICADAAIEDTWTRLRLSSSSMVVVCTTNKLEIADAFLGSLPAGPRKAHASPERSRTLAYFRMQGVDCQNAFRRLVAATNQERGSWEVLPFDEHVALFQQALEMHPPDRLTPEVLRIDGEAVLRVGFLGTEAQTRTFLRQLALVAHYPGCREVRVLLFGEAARLAGFKGDWQQSLTLEAAGQVANESVGDCARRTLELHTTALLYVVLDTTEQLLDLRNSFHDRFPSGQSRGDAYPRVVALGTQTYSDRALGSLKAGLVTSPMVGPWDELRWLDGLAAQYDRAYQEQAGQAPRAWSDVPHDQRENSRALARHLSVKLRCLGWDTDSNHTPDQALIERLAEIEHQRYWTAKLLDGWRLGPRDNVARTHPDLVPWSALTEQAKEKDRIMVRRAPEIARAAGFKLSRR